MYASGVAFGQTPDADLTFEVASVRPSGPSSANSSDETPSDARLGGPGTANPGRIFYSHASLQRLLMDAYQVQPDQIAGPEWLPAEKFVITANVRKGATPEEANAMLQNLLIERFKLALHHTTKEGTVYQLTVDRGGAKLAPAAAGERRRGMQSTRNNGLQRKTCRGCTIADLIQGVQGFDTHRLAPDRIVDQTGLKGSYDFTLEYAGSQSSWKLSAIQSQEHAGQDLFSALEKQLGLKLEKGKGPVDMLVIDHLEKIPTEN